YIHKTVGTDEGIFVAASDYMKALPLAVSKWFPGPFTALGTDGFGKSDHRVELREHFEVNAEQIAWATLLSLHEEGKISQALLRKAKKKLNVDENKASPTAL
ncbi:MAG: pyruvate dehydrogenase (acetyl-transferring), homodimeric type, partial [Bacteroidota bacterium]